MPNPSNIPALSGRVQRKCCEGKEGSSEECDDCRQKRKGKLQRAAINFSSASNVPPIVYEAIRSSGQHMDEDTRHIMEHRFNHDFSRVRIHSDALAAKSATAVGAMAYTVGNHLVFGSGKFMPTSSPNALSSGEGHRLLLHELAHVVQQESTTQQSTCLKMTAPDDAAEREATSAENATHANSSHTVTPKPVEVAREELNPTPPSPPVEREFELEPHLIPMEGRAVPECERGLEWLDPAVGKCIPIDGVLFTGSELVVSREGKEVSRVAAVSGNPGSKEFEKGVGPIPGGTYSISPQITRATVTKLQSGVCGADAISSGFQQITSEDPSPCDDPTNHFCTVACPTPDDPGRRCFTPKDCWGSFRVKIEGSAKVKTPAGATVTRSGFYIHGGNHAVAVTSGCIKVLDDSVFGELRKFKKTVPLIVSKQAAP